MSSDNLLRAISYVNRKTKDYVRKDGTPGVGITIVTSNNNVFQKGYGVENLETCKPYTEDTVILLASVSKVISGTLLCILQKEKKKELINSRTKTIVTNEKYVTRNMTVKDLISHRSGIKEQYGTNTELLGYSRQTIMSRVKYTTNREFRNLFQYTNIPFTQGIVDAIRKAELSIEEAYNKMFFIADMKNSSINYLPLKYKGYVDLRTLGCDCSEDIWYPSYYYNLTEQVSAGGIYSNLSDMSNFVQFHLRQGRLPSEKRIVDDQFYQGVYINNNIVEGFGIDIVYRTYSDRLYKFYSHSGALENTRTYISWTQELDIGIFVHTNSSVNGFPEAISAAFYTIFSGGSIEDANIIFDLIYKEAFDDISSDFTKLKFKLSNTCRRISPELPGKYFNPVAGTVTISSSGKITVGKLCPTKLYRCNEFLYNFILYNKAKLPFKGMLKICDNGFYLNYYGETNKYILS